MNFASYIRRLLIATPSGNPNAGEQYDYWKADGQLYTKDSAGRERLVGLPEIYTLNANATTTAATATATNLSLPIAVNEVILIEFFGTMQCSSTGGSKYAIGAPAGGTIEGWLETSGAAITTIVKNRIVAINTLTTTAGHTVATTPAPDYIQATIFNGATAGNIVIQIASVTAAQTTTLFKGAFLKIMRMKAV